MTKDTATRSGSITDAAGDAANTEKITTTPSRKTASSGKNTTAKKAPATRSSAKKAPAAGKAVPDKGTAPKAAPAKDAPLPSPETKTPAKPAARKRSPAKPGAPAPRKSADSTEKTPQGAAPSGRPDTRAANAHAKPQTGNHAPRSAPEANPGAANPGATDAAKADEGRESVNRDASNQAAEKVSSRDSGTTGRSGTARTAAARHTPESASESPAPAKTASEKKPAAKRGAPRKRAATPPAALAPEPRAAAISGDSAGKGTPSGPSVKNAEPATHTLPVTPVADSSAVANTTASETAADKTPQAAGNAKKSRSRKKTAPAASPASAAFAAGAGKAPAPEELPASPAGQPAPPASPAGQPAPAAAARRPGPETRARGNGSAPDGSAKNKTAKPRPRSIAEAEAMLAEEKAARNTVPGKPVPEKSGMDARAERDSREAAPEESSGTGAVENGPTDAPEGEQKRRRRSRRGGRRRNKKNAAPASGETVGEIAAENTGEDDGESNALDTDARFASSEADVPGPSQTAVTDVVADAVADGPASAPSEPGGKEEKKGKNRSGSKDGKSHGKEPRSGGDARENARATESPKNGEPGKQELPAGSSRRTMYISVLAGEQVEVVLTEEGQVLEYYVEMAHQAKIKGNIYKAVISNVDANLQAAFVSYGGSKNGFLQIDEVHPEYYQTPHDPSKRKYPLIQKALKPGQEILVQVVKEPAGTKGAFLTSYLSLPGRFLVLTPGREQIGVSRKVDSEEERARLREMLTGLKPGPGLGVIVRTVSMGATKTSLQRDLQFLKRLWKEVRGKGQEMSSPSLIYQELDLATRAIRDYLTDEVNDVWVDDEGIASSMQEMADMLFPRKKNLVHIHKDADQGSTLFERFGIQKQLDQIYSRDVVLPSGGRLVFDHTEALTAIDINSGKSGGKSNFEDMAYRTNLEAARMIPLQLRLRDIGGQIVADFIEMRERDHWREVEKAVRTGMKGDRARYDVGKIGPFGMLEIVRQRLGSSAISVSTEPCPCCKGTGVRRNMEWQAMRALREINKLMRQAASQKQEKTHYAAERELALHLLNAKRTVLETMEKEFGVKLSVSIGV